MSTLVGVISDTHGLLRPEAEAELSGSDLILHAGDVGDGEILATLGHLAAVRAVRGNIDKFGPASQLPDNDVIEIEDTLVYLLHDLGDLDLDPAGAGFRVVVTGHSHQPSHEERDGVLYFNPGSAGPQRFRLPVTLGRLRVSGSDVSAEIIQLSC